MSEMGFYLLPTGKLHKKKTKRAGWKIFLQDILIVFIGIWLITLIILLGLIFTEELHMIQIYHQKKYRNIFLQLLISLRVFKLTSFTAWQEAINNASFQQKHDPISKNILWRQNPLEIAIEDISTFDAENLIVGSLLRELGKKN